MKYVLSFLLLFNTIVGHASVSKAETIRLFNKLNRISGARSAPIKFVDCGSVNAYTTEYGVYMCNETLSYATAPQMAAIIGHELGHFKFMDPTYNSNQKSKEYRADYWGSKWAEQIGYNHCETAKLFLRFYKDFGNGGGWFADHPANLDRYKRLSKGCK